MPKHTPGPWKWNGMEAIRAKDPYGDSEIVCSMATEDPESTFCRNKAESEANARLIASAPEMYKALDQAPIIRLDETLKEFKLRLSHWHKNVVSPLLRKIQDS